MPTLTRDLLVTDPNPALAPINRSYTITIPSSGTGPVPLLMYFHGQGGDMTECDAFNKLGEKLGFITVSAQGLATSDPSTRAWSVGTEGRHDVCTNTTPTVFPSCRITHRVSNCNWATCYSDFFFAQQLLAVVLAAYPRIDRRAIYLTGASNGAMFADALAARLPPSLRAAAVVAWYGAYLRGEVPPARSLGKVSFLALHGAKDVTIPATGGESYDGYLYASEADSSAAFAAANQCDPTSIALTTPFGGSPRHVCTQHRRCGATAKNAYEQPRASVAYCLFPTEAHGFWPGYAENMTWWWLSGLSR